MKQAKLILVLIDALGYQTMSDRCGYLGHLVECGKAARYKVRGELPAVSRPMYETVMTGLPASAHGVTTNAYCGGSRCPNLFSMAKAGGMTTAAAAYKWMAELYNGTPAFDVRFDRYQMGRKGGSIDYGFFYYEDSYLDTHLYGDAEYLRQAYQPNFLLVHPMGVDDAGHRYGSSSEGYQKAANKSISALSQYIDLWRGAGYDIVVTADHGMDNFGVHLGDTPAQREVPLYILSDRLAKGDFTGRIISQLNIAPLACYLLGLPRAPGMIDPKKEIEGVDA